MITFDTLLIKVMQTAQLTFNGRTITEFFAVLFLFRCREKVRDPPNFPRSVICWDLFLYLVLQMGDTVGPRYNAPKISAISYLFRTFSLLIMGDTEQPRYTGFRGLSVRGITALQCTTKVVQIMTLVDLDPFYAKVKFGHIGFCMGKS